MTPIVIRHRRSVTDMIPARAPVLSFAGDDEFEELMEFCDSSIDDLAIQAIPKQLGENSIFITQRPEGAMRDVINVECSKINGELFKGTITYTEATIKIAQNILGLCPNDLHSIKMSFNKCRVILFKLMKQLMSCMSRKISYWRDPT